MTMKTIPKIIFLALLLSAGLIWQSCCSSGLHFKGRIVDAEGNGISEAAISVGDKKDKSGKNGGFEICVERSGRYVVNVTKLGYGFASKIYHDTTGTALIRLARATVKTFGEGQDIVVQDMRPEMSSPLARVASPLDTIPFVYNGKGELIGFTRPKELSDARKSLTNYQPQTLGARIEIPANSFVIEGTLNQPNGNIEISLNTVDLYSSDGMPGDYTARREKDRDQGFMVPFGAANIEAFANGKSLQLKPNSKATLTIPIDTLSIITGAEVPALIPLMVYDRKSGLWNIEGTASLNAEKTAYTTEISHFSTYNMDLFKSAPSCIQICKELAAGATLTITATDGTKTTTRTMPTDPSACASGRCIVFGPTSETAGIINMPNNTNAELVVASGGSTVATYIINSGPQPGGFSSPADYQKCDFDACAGPFYITDNRCWEIKDAVAPFNVTGMSGPVMTFKQNTATSTDIDFTWIFVQNTSGGVITNNANTYFEVEYQTLSSSTSFTSLGTWEKVVFTLSGTQVKHYPRAATGIVEWNPATLTAHFLDGSENPTLNMSDVLLFRVNAFINPVAEPETAANINPTNLGVIAVRNFNSTTWTTTEKSSFLSDVNAAGGPNCHIIIN